MKRLQKYEQFMASDRVNEEFLKKLYRKLTGADEKEIDELSAKIKAEYAPYSEDEKRTMSRRVEKYISDNGLSSNLIYALEDEKWYKDFDYLKMQSKDLAKVVTSLEGILGVLQGAQAKAEIESDREKARKKKKIEDLNAKVQKYKEILNKYDELTKISTDQRYDIAADFEPILKQIPGCPWPAGAFFGSKANYGWIDSFVARFDVYNKDKEFAESHAFTRLSDLFERRRKIIEETGCARLFREIMAERAELWKDEELKRDVPSSPIELLEYEYYEKAIAWVKESLAGKTVQQVLRLMMKDEKTVVIEKSDSKSVRTEGEKIFAGNIAYTGQNFNNMNMERIGSFIRKEGSYKTTDSGMGMFAANNIAYAFYYCHYRFGLQSQQVTETMFPTVYKIELKPGSEFFYNDKGKTNIEEKDLKLALIYGACGFHSGDQIVNRQSVEISIFTEDCVQSFEPIAPKDLIAYLESPQLQKDNEWIETERYRIGKDDANWYKNLAMANKKVEAA